MKVTSMRTHNLFAERPVVVLASLLAVTSWSFAARAEPLAVCASVPDLGDIARLVGGDDVTVTVLTKGPQDPHNIEAKPSFVRVLHGADAFIQIGLELEVGWAPVLLNTARNSSIQPGGPGYIDASESVRPLAVPEGTVDRSRGDVHALGNPHYLLDPLNGIRVATLLAERFATLRPTKRSAFASRLDTFRLRLARVMFGAPLVEHYREELPKLISLLERGGTQHFFTFLEQQKQLSMLGGWLGTLRPHAGARFVTDHDTWAYIAARFGFNVVAFLEPKPGLSPSTKHLGNIVRLASDKEERIAAVLSCVYFKKRHAEFVARHAGVPVVPMAHQSGSRPRTEGYIEMLDYNVEQLAAALTTRGEKRP